MIMITCTTDRHYVCRAGQYSPQYIRLEELPPGTVTFLEEEDTVRRNFDQQKALKGSKVRQPSDFVVGV